MTIDRYDGAEICELVGLYRLSQIYARTQQKYRNLQRRQAGHNKANPNREIKMTKKIILGTNELRIAVEANKTVIDFLDVTLNLRP